MFIALVLTSKTFTSTEICGSVNSKIVTTSQKTLMLLSPGSQQSKEKKTYKGNFNIDQYRKTSYVSDGLV